MTCATLDTKEAVFLHEPGVVCALGSTTDEVRQGLMARTRNELTVTDEYSVGRFLPLGMAACSDHDDLNEKDNSRSNRLLLDAVAQIRGDVDLALRRFDSHRIGIVLGTSTSGIAEGEKALAQVESDGVLPLGYHYEQQEIGAPSRFLARYLGVSGPAMTVSTACSSGAKSLASARRLLRSGVCDAVICGGVDTLCRLTVNGFDALDSVSHSVCNPFSHNRNGLNVGEGACVFLMSRTEGAVQLSGAGETSDAYHISAPRPDGMGAQQAMMAAIRDAGLNSHQIGYINLHGTATFLNDRMESYAVQNVFGDSAPCSSTKPLTGHALGAAGALETAFCWLALTGDDCLPVHWWDGENDPELAHLNFVSRPDHHPHRPKHVLSNSFAFGGNNISLVLSAGGY